MTKIMIIVIAAILIAVAVISVIKKIKHGSSCCGEHEAMEDKVKPADSDPKHYEYHYCIKVEGMMCGKCVRHVENAFHKTGDMLAKANLETKEVYLHSKRELDRRETAKIVDSVGYTLTDFKEEKKA